jgi:hypothetical protein
MFRRRRQAHWEAERPTDYENEGIQMKKLIALALVCVSSVLVLAAFATAGSAKKQATRKFNAVLNVGQEVMPRPKGTQLGASGRFTVSVTGTTLKWTLTFTHLTGSATAAHIHGGVRGKAGAVLIPLCGPCTSPQSGTGTITAAQLADMVAGKDYVNVHTAKNPSGEIRGQITHV